MKKLPSLLVYDPYLTTLGGGERYILTLAELLQKRYNLTVGSPRLPTAERLQQLGLPAELYYKCLPAEDFSRLSGDYDLVIYLTNTIPPRSLADNSWLVVQFPFDQLSSFDNPLLRIRQARALASYKHIVYSEYAQKWLLQRWHKRSVILSPPIVTGNYDKSLKQPLILAVGRFFAGGHNKRHDALIEAYSQLPASVQSSWKLTLAGGLLDNPTDKTYFAQLQSLAKGLNIEFLSNISQVELSSLYQEASFFWHATGYLRANSAPEKAEHFGMTTIEAMSYGCIPLVYADGGQLEIVGPQFGRLWKNPTDLALQTTELISSPLDQLTKQAKAAHHASNSHTLASFAERVKTLWP